MTPATIQAMVAVFAGIVLYRAVKLLVLHVRRIRRPRQPYSRWPVRGVEFRDIYGTPFGSRGAAFSAIAGHPEGFRVGVSVYPGPWPYNSLCLFMGFWSLMVYPGLMLGLDRE